jgi:ABC-type Fe3+/spermidine/putrescine transport system ATPase subunit
VTMMLRTNPAGLKHDGAVLAARHSSPFIEARGIVAAYGEKVAVRGVSLAVNAGEQLSLLGPSGCGKSTFLRCIAGLETPLEGEISINGRIVFSRAKRINVPPEKRMLSMVFQSYAIWPHMSVFENVAYGLRMRGMRGSELNARVEQSLLMVGLNEMRDRPATALSGGQQQRVALARAYAPKPEVILLDEPLSNLDARLRTQMREELKDLQRAVGVSMIYVTHDQEEAMAMSDRIVVMRDGAIEQEGRPLDIYERPRTRFVANFIGAANILCGRLLPTASTASPLIRVNGAELGCAAIDRMPAANAQGDHLVAVRPVYAELSAAPSPNEPNQWPATVEGRVLLGDTVSYRVRFPGGDLQVLGSPKILFEQNARVFLCLPKQRVILIEH